MQSTSKKLAPRGPRHTVHNYKNPFSSDENKAKRDISSFLLKYKNKPFHPIIKASTINKNPKKKIQSQKGCLSNQELSEILNLLKSILIKIDKTDSSCLALNNKMEILLQNLSDMNSILNNNLNVNFRKVMRKIKRFETLIRILNESIQNFNNVRDNDANEDRKKIYFVDKACITVNFIVSKLPNDNEVAIAKEKLENVLCEGNNLFIDKTIVLDADADVNEPKIRNENVSREQNALENDINNNIVVNHEQSMEEDSKIEDEKEK